MRKKLLFCSALLLSASLAGCGYNEDNIRETVPELPSNCTRTDECHVGLVSGQCVAGTCLRYCGNFEDCTEGTMCEDGVCRPIIECPSAGSTQNIAGEKCLEVFSVTPKSTWTKVLETNVQENAQTIAEKSLDYPNDFTSNKFTFQLPQRSLSGGLNYSLVMMVALVFIKLENEASSALMKCLMPSTKTDSACEGDCAYTPLPDVDERNYNIGFNEELASEIKMDQSLLDKVCLGAMSDSDGLGQHWKNDFTKTDSTNRPINSTYMNRFEDSKDCAYARLLWDTLSKVKNMVGSMTMTQIDDSPLATAIFWAQDLLDDGKTIKRSTKITDATEIVLPKLDGFEDIKSNIVEIHQGICKNIMYGLIQNTATAILKNSSVNLVKCLMNDQLVPNLINSSLNIIKQYRQEATLDGIIKALGEIMTGGDAQMQQAFSNVDAMVGAMGDPSWIWLTTNLYQELNILEKTDSNNFKNNTLLLHIQYTGKASGITDGVINLDGYQNGDINYTTGSPNPNSKELTPTLTTNYAKNSSSEFVLLSNRPSENTANHTSTHAFYVHPTVANNNSSAECGGIVLDVSAIKGYVVLTKDDIQNRSGHAIILKKDE